MVYQECQLQKYRITLDLEVMSDFDPRELDWDAILKLEGNEHLSVDVKELDDEDLW